MKSFERLFPFCPSFVLFLLAASFIPSTCTAENGDPVQSKRKDGSRPNIVFILADDMNRDTWGIYGSENCKTPHIDRLASEGMRFDHAYCAVSMCAPFRQELYSGRTPWRTNTLPNHSRSKAGTRSIVHYLKPLGYKVALIGKSHVGPKECYPFDHYPGKNKAADQNPFFVKKTRDVIGECGKSSKPFCIFIASSDGHSPYTTGDTSVFSPEKFTIPPYWLDTKPLRSTLVKYYAEVSNFDRLVGQIRKELEAADQWENTILMVCSEQGTGLPFAKWTCYDNGLHTGLVAHWPKVIQPGSVAGNLISIADITPTLVDAAGGKLAPEDCDGKSFLPTLQGKDQELNDYVYGAFTNCNIIGNRDRIFPVRVIRNKKYSLIYNPNFSSQTSNVTVDAARKMLTDPSKTGNDVAASWVRLARKDASALPLVKKLHHRPEYEFYALDRDPAELKNEIQNAEFKSEIERMKKRLHSQLKLFGDSDPIETEKSLVR